MSDVGLSDATCLGCGQPLQAITEHRCPECGRTFDPDDPGTYLTADVANASQKLFDVYRHATNGYEAVKRGFSWPWSLFHAIWAFTKQLWLVGVTLFVVHALLDLATQRFEYFYKPVLSIASLVLVVVVGACGNEWRRAALRRRGYEHAYTVPAASPHDAINAAVGKVQPNVSVGLPNPVARLILAFVLCALLGSLGEVVKNLLVQ